jgi:hypothetical protein
MAMVANYGNLCGMALDQIIETVNQMIAVVEDRIAEPQIWQAIVAVADSLKFGRNDGQAIARIITRELRSPL